MKKKYISILGALAFSFGLVSCSDSGDDPIKEIPPQEEVEVVDESYFYANFFGYQMMNDAYLWKQDVAQALSKWGMYVDPIAETNAVRYKDASGKDIDKWTMMTDDYDSMVGGTDGVSYGTYGCNYKFYLKEQGKDDVVAFVTFTYPDSPAEKAGLKRGDVVLEIDGKPMNQSNYTDLYYSSSLTLGVGKYLGNGAYSSVQSTCSMNAVSMYEDPVVLAKTFDCGGKKVGYLLYTSFTFESSLGLINVCKQFKQEGISELILDLRYNGGGYVFTENVFASMLAPADVVASGSVLSTEVYNDEYMAYFKEQNEDLSTYFTTQFKQAHNDKMYNLNTSDANLGLTKIYALVASGTASASESILVCLMPYMDIEVIGEQTHGKYCSGIMQEGKAWYQKNANAISKIPELVDWKQHIGGWGIYLMISMYADKDGNNPCMPNGLTPDVQATDLFEEPYPLGDEREALLNIALQKAGKTDLTPRAVSRSATSLPEGQELKFTVHPLEKERILTGDLGI